MSLQPGAATTPQSAPKALSTRYARTGHAARDRQIHDRPGLSRVYEEAAGSTSLAGS